MDTFGISPWTATRLSACGAGLASGHRRFLGRLGAGPNIVRNILRNRAHLLADRRPLRDATATNSAYARLVSKAEQRP